MGYHPNFKSGKCKTTDEGGFAVLTTASEALNAGEIVMSDPANIGKVCKVVANEDRPCGIVYANAGANEPVWIVVSGFAKVRFDSTTTPANDFYHVYVSATEAGKASGASSVNSTRHWGEIGHIFETGAIGGLVTCIIHFN